MRFDQKFWSKLTLAVASSPLVSTRYQDPCKRLIFAHYKYIIIANITAADKKRVFLAFPVTLSLLFLTQKLRIPTATKLITTANGILSGSAL